jgi:uncharacterized protein YjbI with pentapeptide repeats
MGEVLGIPFWKLLDILAVPIVAAIAVPVFTWLQKMREVKVDNHRRQEDGLQAYVDQMTQLLLDKNLRSNSKANSEARTAARAGTLTTLERIHHPDKKGIIVKFLWECSLLKKQGAEDAVVTLEGANLKEAALGGAPLFDADLSGADLSGADLRKALLRGADLSGADLRKADLRKADLRKALLRGAEVTEKQLAACKSRKEAIMPNGQKYEEWLKNKGSGEENSGPS